MGLAVPVVVADGWLRWLYADAVTLDGHDRPCELLCPS